MATYRTVASDISEIIQQTFDDRKVEFAQVFFWVIVVADRLRMLHEVKRRSGAFVTSFVVDVLTDAARNNRPYIPLPGRIYDLDMDGAVDYIGYFVDGNDGLGYQWRTFGRSRPSQISSQKGFHKSPSIRNPIMVREGDKLYLLGISPDTPKVEVGLKLALPDVTEVDPDAELPFPVELLYVLQQHVLSIARFALAVPDTKLKNDGTESMPGAQQAPLGKTVSVNDPVITDPSNSVQ